MEAEDEAAEEAAEEAEEAAEEAAVCVEAADVTHQKNASKAVTSGTDNQYEKHNKHVRVPVTRTKRRPKAALCDCH